MLTPLDTSMEKARARVEAALSRLESRVVAVKETHTEHARAVQEGAALKTHKEQLARELYEAKQQYSTLHSVAFTVSTRLEETIRQVDDVLKEAS